MISKDIETLMVDAGIKPTSNRILVLRELSVANRPLSLMELDSILETLDKSSIFRVLSLFFEHGIVHGVEDGRGIVRYEVCTGHCAGGELGEGEPDSDLHVHFYCEKCQEVFCFDEIPTPEVKVPEGFHVNSVNYMLKGICPGCKKK